MEKFTGLGVAIITPFTSENTIDETSLRKIVNHLIDGNVDFLVPLGSTGEAITLTFEEKKQVLKIVFDENNGKLPILVGAGGSDTAQVCKDIQTFEAEFPQINGFLSSSPAYNKPSQEGIYQHFSAIAKCTEKPIMLYNVPGRTCSNMSAETTVRLAQDFKNIIGIKEASGDLVQGMEIIRNKPENFVVISGEDALTIGMIAAGFDGVISVIANAYPKEFSEMVHSSLKGDFETARNRHYQLLHMTNLIFKEGNPAGIKSLMNQLELCKNNLRLPLIPVSEGLSEEIQANLLS